MLNHDVHRDCLVSAYDMSPTCRTAAAASCVPMCESVRRELSVCPMSPTTVKAVALNGAGAVRNERTVLACWV